MDTELFFKGLVILLLLSVLFSLFSGLVYLVRDHGRSDRSLKSLALRIAISLALFLFLFAGLVTGLIHPHGLPVTDQATEQNR